MLLLYHKLPGGIPGCFYLHLSGQGLKVGIYQKLILLLNIPKEITPCCATC